MTEPTRQRIQPDKEARDELPVPPERVADLLTALGKAVRAHQLYERNNPIYRRFVTGLQGALAALWDDLDELEVRVAEETLHCEGEPVYRNPSRNDSLAFLLHKDGVRSLTFLPGFEEEEVVEFLEVLHHAKHLRTEEDDLLTLLWEGEFEHLRYQYVDLLAEEAPIPEASSELPGGLPDLQKAELAELEEVDEEASEEAAGEAQPAVKSSIAREDFDATLYFLDDKELDYLRDEVEREMERDLRTDVLSALFDRMEEPRPERQAEILEILQTLLPNFLSRGALEAATEVLAELRRLRESEELGPDALRELDALMAQVASPETLSELMRALEAGAIRPSPEVLGRFLSQLGEEALGPLLRAVEATRLKELRRVLDEAVERIGETYGEALVGLLDSDDPLVVAGAARLAGRIGLAGAAQPVAALLDHPEPAVRLAAVEAAVALRSARSVDALQKVLLDSSREVRLAAARGLGSLGYEPAAPLFREILESKEIRDADLTEKIAFFEGYGNLGEPEAVEVLDAMLNGKGFLGRRESSEIRACAALALGRIDSEAARAALRRSADDDDPIVKSAVGRALKGEG